MINLFVFMNYFEYIQTASAYISKFFFVITKKLSVETNNNNPILGTRNRNIYREREREKDSYRK